MKYIKFTFGLLFVLPIMPILWFVDFITNGDMAEGIYYMFAGRHLNNDKYKNKWYYESDKN